MSHKTNYNFSDLPNNIKKVILDQRDGTQSMDMPFNPYGNLLKYSQEKKQLVFAKNGRLVEKKHSCDKNTVNQLLTMSWFVTRGWDPKNSNPIVIIDMEN